MRSSDKLVIVIEGLLFAALAYLLSLIFVTPIGNTGIVLTLGFALIIFYGFRRGVTAGLLSGTLLGVATALNTVDPAAEPVVFAVMVLASTLLGLAGLFARNLQRTLHNRRMSSVYLNLITGTILSLGSYFLLRLLSQKFLIAGANPAWAQVLRENGINFAVNTVIILTILIIILNTSSKFFIPQNSPYISRKERSRLLND